MRRTEEWERSRCILLSECMTLFMSCNRNTHSTAYPSFVIQSKSLGGGGVQLIRRTNPERLVRINISVPHALEPPRRGRKRGGIYISFRNSFSPPPLLKREFEIVKLKFVSSLSLSLLRVRFESLGTGRVGGGGIQGCLKQVVPL